MAVRNYSTMQFLLLIALLALLVPSQVSAQGRDYDHDTEGNRTASTQQIRFTTTSAFQIEPRRALFGDRVNIYGQNFPLGAPATYSVTLGGVPATVTNVGTRVVTFEINAGGVASGPIVLTAPGQSPITVGEILIEGVMITPQEVDAFYGDLISFSSTVIGTANPTVTWEVNGIPGGNASVGIIDVNGNYTLPSNLKGATFPLLVGARSPDFNGVSLAVVNPGCSATSNIAVGQPETGTFTTTSERFCFDYAATAGDSLLLAYVGTPSARLKVRSPAGLEIIVAGPSDAISQEFTPGQTATYRIEIEPAETVTGDFGVGIVRFDDPSLFYWTSAGGGEWDDASNWNQGSFPGMKDDAFAAITGAGEVLSNATNAINDFTSFEPFRLQGGSFDVHGDAVFNALLTIASGTWRGPGTSTSNDRMRWNGGTLQGPGQFRSNGDLELGVTTRTLRDGMTFESAGDTTWTGGNLNLTFDATFRNLTGATFDSQADTFVGNGGGAGVKQFENLGTFTKSGGTGLTTVSNPILFNNAGSVEVQTGTLALHGGGKQTGDFTIASGGRLELRGTHSFNGTNTVDGAGVFEVRTGDTTLESPVIVPSSVSVEVTGGDLSVNTALTDLPGLTITSGTLSGTGSTEVTGPTQWNGGQMSGTGQTTLMGPLTLDVTTKTIRDGWTLNLLGPTTWVNGNLNYTFEATVNNQASATFDAQDDDVMANGGGGGTKAFNNLGAFLKSGGTGTTTVANPILFHNNGSVDVQAGTLALSGGGTSTGTFNVTTGTTLDLRGDHDITGNNLFTGGGTVQVSSGTTVFGGDPFTANAVGLRITSGTANVDGTVSALNTLTQTAGVLGGTGSVTVANQTLWNGGAMEGSGTTTLLGPTTLDVTTKTIRSGRTVDFGGPTEWLDGAITFTFEATANNLAGNTFDALDDDAINNGGGAGAKSFHNMGTFVKSGGTGITTVGSPVAFDNSGAVEVQSGTLSLQGGGTSTGSFTIDSGTTLDLRGSHDISGTNTIDGGGRILVTSGTTNVEGPAFTSNSVNLAITSGTVNVTGDLSSLNGFTQTAGSLGGTGTVSVSGPTTWSAGAHQDAGVTNFTGPSIWDLSTKTVRGGRTINLMSPTDWIDGAVTFTGEATVHNQAGATFSALSDDAFSNGGLVGTKVFQNDGSFLKSGGTGNTTVANPVLFDNDGLVHVQSGTLRLDGGGSSTGDFLIDASRRLELRGSHVLDGGASVGGSGTFSIASGTTQIDDTVTLANTLDLAVNGGTLTTSGNLIGLATATITSGSIAGDGTLTVLGPTTWAGGTLSGTGELIASDTLALNGTTKTLGSGWTMTNTTGATWTSGSLNMGQTSTILNQAAATFDVQSNLSMGNAGGVGTKRFDNQGLFLKSGGTGAATVGTPILFDNTGTVEVQIGTLNLQGGGTSNGDFETSAGTVLQLSGSHNLQNGATFSGTGESRVISGTTVVTGTVQNEASSLFVLSGGALGGAGLFESNGDFRFAGGSMIDPGETRANGTLFLTGTTKTIREGRTLTVAGDADWDAGAITMTFDATLAILPGSTLDSDGNLSFNNGGGVGTRRVDNQGTFSKSSGTGSTTVNNGIMFDNSGLVDVQTGEIRLNGGGSSDGVFNTATGTELEFNGTPVLASGAQFTGDGAFRFASGTTTLTGPVSAAANTEVIVSGATLLGPGELQANGDTRFLSGVLGVDSALTTLGPLFLEGSNRSIREGGTLTITDGATWSAGAITMIFEATLINGALSTFETPADLTLNTGGGVGDKQFQNQGTFRKSGGTGITTISGANFNNTGQVEVQSGTLRLIGGGDSTGQFQVDSIATLELGGNHELASGVSFAGPGTSVITGGTTSVNGAVSGTANARVGLSGGTLSGTGSLTTQGTMLFAGGSMSGSGQATSQGLLELSGTTRTIRDGWTLNNEGTAVWTSGNMTFTFVATVNNDAGAIWDAQGNQSISNGGGIGAREFNNAGTFVKSGGGGTTSIAILFNNSGLIDAQDGVLNFGNLTQTAGTLQLNGGDVSGLVNLNGGALTGSGQANATVVSESLVQVGGLNNAGQISSVNTYTQGLGGTLDIELGGTTPGSFDVLQIDGVANLGGTLDLSIIGAYSPTVGDTFEVVTFNSRNGMFDTVTGTSLGGGLNLSVTYGTQNVVVEVTP